MRHSTRLEVHLERLHGNFNLLRKTIGQKDLLFMIKANAYGHGFIPLFHHAFHQENVREFGVASLGAALAARNEFPELKSDIYVFSDLELEGKLAEAYHQKGIIPVLHSLADLQHFLSIPEFCHVPLVLKFDTGMHRLGIEIEQLPELVSLLKNKGRKSIYHLMSHFSCSFNSVIDDRKTTHQYECFLQLKKELRQAGFQIERTSISASGAIEQGIGVIDETHVRPGLMLYGPSALDHQKDWTWQGKNISTLKTKIIRLFPGKKGMEVGYGHYALEQDGLVAVLSMGYGDGLPISLTGASFEHKGFTGKLVGRQSMDLSFVLFPPEAEGQIRLHDEICIWDDDYSRIFELANCAHSIPYEVFTNISSRIPRIYCLK